MPSTCPYDGDFCQEKSDRYNHWCAAVEYAAENKLNNIFYTSADMFKKCPREYSPSKSKTECERYLRYCFIKNQENQK